MFLLKYFIILKAKLSSQRVEMAHYEKHLYLKRSALPGAGKGLFTRMDIPGRKKIVEYKGRLQPWLEVKAEDGHNGYIFKINSKIAINALPYKKALGRYANDARGFGKVTGIRNNSEYIVEGNRCYIVSIRKIRKGEEILVPYGKKYWDLVKKVKGLP